VRSISQRTRSAIRSSENHGRPIKVILAFWSGPAVAVNFGPPGRRSAALERCRVLLGQWHAPIRPIRQACAVQRAPASCSSSNGSPSASFTSIQARRRPSQRGAVLTVHERLTAPGVVINFPSCRARARKDRRAFWLGPCPSPSTSAIAVPDSTSAETRVRPARFVPPRRSNTHKSHLAPIQIP
jgi:hypothetical protein